MSYEIAQFLAYRSVRLSKQASRGACEDCAALQPAASEPCGKGAGKLVLCELVDTAGTVAVNTPYVTVVDSVKVSRAVHHEAVLAACSRVDEVVEHAFPPGGCYLEDDAVVIRAAKIGQT